MAKIAFRVDGGSYIGMGHIMRSLVIAKELCKTNEVFYVCKFSKSDSSKYSPGIARVKEQGFYVVNINEEAVLEDLEKIDADILFTDSYDVSKEYFNKVKSLFKKSIYLDDLNSIDYYNVDMLINPNLGTEDFNYITNENTVVLKGAQYSILREEFRNSEAHNIKIEVKDILITMGGADPPNFTETLLEYISGLPFRFHVVIGNSFKNFKVFQQSEKNYRDNIKLYFNVNMCELMKEMDLAITAGGSTIYELSSLGIPHLLVILADNQENVASILNNKGISINLGWYNKITKEQLTKTLLNLIKDYDSRLAMHKKQLKYVNRLGVHKIVQEINLMEGYYG